MESSDVYNAHRIGSFVVQHRWIFHEAVSRPDSPSPDRNHGGLPLNRHGAADGCHAREQMAITYIAVLGFEAISALALSIILLHESGSLAKFAGVAFVLAGIALLRTGKF